MVPKIENKKMAFPRKRSLSFSETVIAITQVKTKKKKRIEAMTVDDWKVIEKGTFIFNENQLLVQKNSVFLAPRNSTVFDVFMLLFDE